jgi:hypothetical protein
MDDDDFRCLFCGQTPDHCQGGHGDPCEDCHGWMANPGTHEPFCPEVRHLPWVTAAFLQDDNARPFFERWDEDARSGVEYLHQWDYGTETDGAHTYVPPTDEGDLRHGTWFLRDPEAAQYPWGAADDTFEYDEYVLAIGPGRMYVSLNRRVMVP